MALKLRWVAAPTAFKWRCHTIFNGCVDVKETAVTGRVFDATWAIIRWGDADPFPRYRMGHSAARAIEAPHQTPHFRRVVFYGMMPSMTLKT